MGPAAVAHVAGGQTCGGLKGRFQRDHLAGLGGGHGLAAVLLGLGLCSSGIQVGAGNQLQNLEFTACDVTHVNVADRASADYGYFNFIHRDTSDNKRMVFIN